MIISRKYKSKVTVLLDYAFIVKETDSGHTQNILRTKVELVLRFIRK